MNAVKTTLWALARRIVTLAISGTLAYLVANWQGWVEQGFMSDPSTAKFWAVVYVLIEFAQKLFRESAKES